MFIMIFQCIPICFVLFVDLFHNFKMCFQIILSGILGMAIGMSLLLWAIKLAPLGTVAILSATTPVILLPVLWLTTKKRPTPLSAIAAVLVVAGTAMLFIAN